MTIEKRMEQMEKELIKTRRMNRIIGILAIGALAFITIGATTAPEKPDEIRAKKIILEDAGGKARGKLSIGEKGPVLELISPDGKTLASLFAEGNSAGLLLTDANGKQRVGLNAGNETTELSFSDANGVQRISLNAQGGTTKLVLNGAGGNQRIGLSAQGNNASITCFDANGKPRAKADLFDNAPNFTLCGDTGTPFWSAIPDKYTE